MLKEIADKIAKIPGVKVDHYPRGDLNFDNMFYCIHVIAKNNRALHELCKLSALANVRLSVYEWSDTELRYMFEIIDKRGYDILKEWSKNAN